MVLVFIIWLIDGFLLSLIYTLVAVVVNKHIGHWLDWLILGYLTTTVFMLVGISKIGLYLLKLYMGCRFAINREHQKIDPLLQSVINRVNEQYHSNYQMNKINIFIAESKVPGSQAIGFNTIILTYGLLKSINDEELKAILAYELGHIYNRDSLVICTVIFGSLTTKVIKFLYNKYISCYRLLTSNGNRFSNKALNLVLLLTLIPLLLFSPIVALNWLVKQLFEVSLYGINRGYVYKADKFARDLGYASGLISYLEARQEIIYTDPSILGQIFAAHPSAMKRIQRLEA